MWNSSYSADKAADDEADYAADKSAEDYDGNDDAHNVADERPHDEDEDDDWLNCVKPSTRRAVLYCTTYRQGCMGLRATATCNAGVSSSF
jgi:hypothetical protein